MNTNDFLAYFSHVVWGLINIQQKRIFKHYNKNYQRESESRIYPVGYPLHVLNKKTKENMKRMLKEDVNEKNTKLLLQTDFLKFSNSVLGNPARIRIKKEKNVPISIR